MKKFVALLVLMVLGTALAFTECSYGNESEIHDGDYAPEDPVAFSYDAVGGGGVTDAEGYRIFCFFSPDTPVTIQETHLDGQSLTVTWNGHGLNASINDHFDMTYEEVYPPDSDYPFGYVVQEYTMFVSLQAQSEQWDAPAGSYTGELIYHIDYF